MRSALLLLLAAGQAAAQTATYDVILRHGTVVDGTGARAFHADIAVRNGFIARIGDLRGARAAVDLDVSRLIVAPGFLNIHSHATPAGVRTAVNMLSQGVTTEIINADGGGSTDIARQLDDFSAAGLAINLGAYAGFNSIWASVMGPADRRPTTADLEKMRELLVTNLKEGAWGVSAGLDYKPAYFATAEEVISVTKAAAPWRTNFPNHDRLTPESHYSSLAGIGETIDIAEKSGLMPVVTHMKVQGREQGNAPRALAMMRAASARGQQATADVYPYLAGQTGLGALLVPAWAQDGGRQAMLQRFSDPQLRPRIAREIEEAIEARFLGPENVDIPAWQHKLTDYMREMNAGAGETLIRILEKDSPSAILKFGSEADLLEILRFPGSAIACDCGASEERPGMHPRFFGTYPRVLGHDVRETKVLTLEDAVRKMTGLPAGIIGMAGRGFVAAGMAADLTVFDAATIIDHATYEKPTLPSEGIRYVLVNGRIAWRDGASTGEKAGRVLARSEHMPSRPQRTLDARSFSLAGRDYKLDLKQSPGSPAHGTVAFPGLKLTEAGILQVDGKWAAFTGRATVDGTDRALLVIADGPVVHVELDGSPWLDRQ